jgi:hypothetical protein
VIAWADKVSPAQGGSVTCVINRDWRTDWSDFNLKAGLPLKTNFGYRVYASYSTQNPTAKGFMSDYTMTVVDGATNTLLTL